jgi:hypothetical protein
MLLRNKLLTNTALVSHRLIRRPGHVHFVPSHLQVRNVYMITSELTRLQERMQQQIEIDLPSSPAGGPATLWFPDYRCSQVRSESTGRCGMAVVCWSLEMAMFLSVASVTGHQDVHSELYCMFLHTDGSIYDLPSGVSMHDGVIQNTLCLSLSS